MATRTLRSVDQSGLVLDEPRIDPATGFLYCTGDGSVEGICEYDGIRELVTKQSIRDQVALCARRPMTDGHPDGGRWVDVDSARELVVGHIDDSPEYIEIDDPALGGYSRARARVRPSAERRDVIEDIKSGRKRGLSFGYTKTIDETPGTHPVFGAYDRVRTHVTAVNHLAFCEVPRVEGSTLIGFDMADPAPSTGDTMPEKPASDAMTLDKVRAMFDAIKDDPIMVALLKTLLGGAEKEEEPAMEAKPEAMSPEAMDAKIKAAIDAAVAPLRADLDAIKATRAAADSAAELSTLRGLARAHGLLTADSADSASCRAHLTRVFPGVSDGALVEVARYASAQPAPRLPVATDSASTSHLVEV